MPEESTTPDLVELSLRFVDAWNRRDIEAAVTLLAPEATWNAAGVGEVRLQGRAAIRTFIEDWLRPYEEFTVEVEQVRDLGNGVAFTVVASKGRLVGGSGFLEMPFGIAGVSDGDRIMSAATYLDIDEGRAAAERLAEERR